jgi:hypothetical protein
MWNPYNVAVTSRMLRFKIAAPLPNAFRFKIGTVQNLKWNSLMPAENTDPPYQALYLTGGNADLAVTNPIVYDIPATYTFKPGETLIHATPQTVTEGDIALYRALTGNRYAQYSSAEFAKAAGLPGLCVDPLHAFPIVFGPCGRYKAGSSPKVAVNSPWLG